MDGVSIAFTAELGKPARVGHLGTVVVQKVLADGQYLIKFTLNKNLEKKWNKRTPRRLVDRM